MSSNARFTVIRRRKQSPDETGSHETALLGIVELIAAMVEASGSFMLDRIQNEVWPQLVRVLQALAIQPMMNENPAMEQTSKGSSIPSTKAVASQIETEKDRLLTTIVRFIQCLFENTNFASKASNQGLVPLMGTMIIPLMGRPDKIGDEAFEAIKMLLRADADILWRPLYSLIEKPDTGTSNSVEVVESATVVDTRLQRRAQDLLDFRLELPEPVL